MRVIYLDSNYHCHVDDDGTRTPIETDFFDGKCATYVEGFLYVPEGKTYVNEEGKEIPGFLRIAWKPHDELDSAQREYEKALIADMQNALNKLGVTLDE